MSYNRETLGLYRSVIDDVMERIGPMVKLEENGEEKRRKLQAIWESKIVDSKVLFLPRESDRSFPRVTAAELRAEREAKARLARAREQGRARKTAAKQAQPSPGAVKVKTESAGGAKTGSRASSTDSRKRRAPSSSASTRAGRAEADAARKRQQTLMTATSLRSAVQIPLPVAVPGGVSLHTSQQPQQSHALGRPSPHLPNLQQGHAQDARLNSMTPEQRTARYGKMQANFAGIQGQHLHAARGGPVQQGMTRAQMNQLQYEKQRAEYERRMAVQRAQNANTPPPPAGGAVSTEQKPQFPGQFDGPGDRKGKVKVEKVKNEEELGSEDDLGSDLDDEEDDRETKNLMVCQYEKVTRTKTKWKVLLRAGIMHLDGHDFVFSRGSGDFTFA